MRPVALSLVLAAGAGVACAPRPSLTAAQAEWFRTRPSIPVAWTATGRPWVECPTREGQDTWQLPTGGGDRSPGALPVQRAALPAGPGGAPVVPAISGTWEIYQDQWTLPLARPPVDPARATAAAFLERNRKDAAPLPLADAPVEVESADPAVVARRLEGAPVLVFQVTRFNLLGCFFTYQPWFIARVSLVDGASGRVVWSDECDSTDYRADWPPFSTRDDLLRNGGERYRWFIEQRAGRCVDELRQRIAASRVPPAG